MKFFSAITLSLYLVVPAFATEHHRHLRQQGDNNGLAVGRPEEGEHPGIGAGGGPNFLEGDDLPPGLVDNPSGVVGVDFKPGRKPKVQRNPNWSNGKSQVRGVDNTIFELDLGVAERINVYSPEQFKESEDGTFVTNIETGEMFPLTVFFQSDEKNGMDITFATEEDGTVFNIRAKPKTVNGGEDQANGAKIQNFQTIPGTKMLAAYVDDDLDLSKAPSFGEHVNPDLEKPLPSAFKEKLNEGGGGRRTLMDAPTNEKQGEEDPRDTTRRTQATYPITLFGKTCTSWDYLDVRIATDRRFANTYSSHQSRAQAIFAEAAEIYWNESCVRLYMWSYSHTNGNSAWDYKIPFLGLQLPWDDFISGMPSGCTDDYGGLDFMRAIAKGNFGGYYRDAWHMFTGTSFTDGNTVGCAWINVCKSEDKGYGVNAMTWTTSLRFQAGTFASSVWSLAVIQASKS